MSVAVECELCGPKITPLHENPCSCICHMTKDNKEGQNAPTQWELTDTEVLNLMDDEKSDSV